jgi:hypothetical protein
MYRGVSVEVETVESLILGNLESASSIDGIVLTEAASPTKSSPLQ